MRTPNPVFFLLATALGVTGLASTWSACSDVPGVAVTDAGCPVAFGSADAGKVTIASADGSQSLKAFIPGGPCDPGAGAIYVTISGESNAFTGYPFPPGDFGQDTYMIDGWAFQIDAFIVVVDGITVWSNPNISSVDQSQHGGQVAHLTGPFVVDLHKGGNIVGQGGYPEEATALGVILSQNDNGNTAFDPTIPYAFGFRTIPAGPIAGYTGKVAGYDAYNVNLDASEAADYAYMVKSGASVYYRGHATWKGSASTCTQTMTGPGPHIERVPVDGGPEGGSPTYVDGGYDFAREPVEGPRGMAFRFAFSTPTSYVNCQNYTAQGMGIGDESSPRGIQVSTNASAIAEVTVHMDHPFWDSFAENSPLHWDQIAAQYVGVTPPDGGIIESHLEDFRGVAFQGFTDHQGTPIPWRNCAGTYGMPPGNGQMSFGTLSVAVNPHETDPSKAIRDYYDYMRYTQSSQGHLNSQGLCYIDRQFPAPPGGS